MIGVGWARNHGRGRTSELPGRKDERVGGPYTHLGRGGRSQQHGPFISSPLTLVSSPLVFHATEILVSHFTLLPLETLLDSFSSFLLKARVPSSQLQSGPLLTLPWGLVPFNSSEAPRLSSQPSHLGSLHPQLLSL